MPAKIVAMCGDGAGMGTASAGMMRGRGQDFTSCGVGDGDGVQSCGDGVGMGMIKFAQCGDGDGLWTSCHSLLVSHKKSAVGGAPPRQNVYFVFIQNITIQGTSPTLQPRFKPW